MTTTKSYTLWCDGDDCVHWFGNEIHRTAADIRRVARLEGWLVALPGSHDLCPDCNDLTKSGDQVGE